MDDFFGAIQFVLTLGLPIGGFLLARRRPGHTRRQLVVAAAIGGGLAGAFMAVLTAAGGGSLDDALPFALFGLTQGLIIGFAGIGALALGRWLGREP